MEYPVPVSLPEQSKPPHTSRLPAIGLLVLVLVGALVGTVAQELRWRGGFMIPQSQLAQAEQAFLTGDNQVAVTLFNGLAAKNNPVAQYWLAHMTELGLGVPRDSAKAIELYKKAAAQDVEAAELRLGEIYLHGDLVPPDFDQAKIYLEKAAYHGDVRAAMLLGQMYRVGIGVTADPREAYAWSEVGTVEGSAFTKRERDASFRGLSVADQKAAVARAQEILKTIRSETAAPKPPSSK
jgi:hypothetical protein